MHMRSQFTTIDLEGLTIAGLGFAAWSGRLSS